MVEVSDDMLMAYADGRLNGPQAEGVATAVAASPELRARLIAYEATNATSEIWRVFDAPMRDPVPRHLIDFVMTHGARPAKTEQSPSRPIVGATILALLQSAFAPWPRTAALATVLAIGVATGWQLHRSAAVLGGQPTAIADGVAGLPATGALQAALESAPAEDLPSVSPGSHWLAAPVLTFRTADGGYCRKYEMARASETTGFSGVACRTPHGQWIVRAHGAATVKRGSVGVVVPASGPTHGLIDSTIEMLRDGDALGPAEDRQALTKGWK